MGLWGLIISWGKMFGKLNLINSVVPFKAKGSSLVKDKFSMI